MENGRALSLHRDMVRSPAFLQALDYALLEMNRQIVAHSRSDNQVTSVALHFKIVGATEFISILKNLGETTKLDAPAKPQTVNHQV